MYNLPLDLSSGDTARWLAGTWVLAHGVPSKVVRTRGTTIHVTARGDTTRIEAKDIAITWPICGSVNLVHTRCAIHVRRDTVRQWRRGFALDTTTLMVPGSLVVQKRLGKMPTCDEEQVANALMLPEYPLAVRNAFSQLASGAVASAALSPTTIVVCDGTIYYQGELVARLSGKGSRMWDMGNVIVPIHSKRMALRVAAVIGLPIQSGKGA